MKIASWNLNSLRVRLPQVLDWLAQEQPDLLALQEIKLTDDKFPNAEIQASGYHALYAGQKTYNGVAILSRAEGTEVITDLPGLDDPQRRVLGATYGVLRVLNLYVPNGQEVGSDKYRYKLDWLDKLAALIEEEVKRYANVVVLGDFNIAPDDRDVHNPEAWEGKILCSGPERQALQRLLSLELNDTFRLFDQAEKTFSWWDYRLHAFRRNMGLRIDLILASQALTATCSSSRVDKIPRGWERPSDHAPVVAEFDFRNQ